MDCEDHIVFTDAMELHYIDMKAFVNTVNETGSIKINDAQETMFVKWLSIITQKEIVNKTIFEDICENEEEIQLAVSTLEKQSKDKITRQEYLRRQDEIYFYNKSIYEYKTMAEQERQRAEQAEAEIKKLRQELDELQGN